jgi:hypothetical protein
MNEVIDKWTNLRNEEFHSVECTSNIIRLNQGGYGRRGMQHNHYTKRKCILVVQYSDCVRQWSSEGNVWMQEEWNVTKLDRFTYIASKNEYIRNWKFIIANIMARQCSLPGYFNHLSLTQPILASFLHFLLDLNHSTKLCMPPLSCILPTYPVHRGLFSSLALYICYCGDSNEQ